MNHYTYLLQSQTSDMMYIGVRSCDCLIEEDRYYGSSKYLPEDVSETFDKFILGRFDTREEAISDEMKRHIKNDVAKNPLFINKSIQKSTGFDTTGLVPWNKGIKMSEDFVEKCKTRKHSEESKLKMSLAKKGKQGTFLGKIHSRESKLKMSKSKENYIPWNKGIKMSEEARKNMSNAVKGRVWVNDGIINKQVTSDNIPEGFVRGRIYKRKN